VPGSAHRIGRIQTVPVAPQIDGPRRVYRLAEGGWGDIRRRVWNNAAHIGGGVAALEPAPAAQGTQRAVNDADEFDRVFDELFDRN
jgi:hypothetical protein